MITDIPDWPAAIKEAREIILGTYSKKTDSGNFDVQYINDPKDFQEAAEILGRALTLLLISKNQKYGKENIEGSVKFGIEPKKGVALRMNDKFERLKNGLQGMDLGKEGFVDSFGDIVGYAAIGLLLEYGWYKLPISEEKK